MSNKIFVSIVIPTFNRSHYLVKILDILKRNLINFRNFEVIICDSYSKDSTGLKIKSFYKQNKILNIKYVNTTKNLHSIKRNLGLKLSSGKYVIFLDDDCFPEIDFVKEYYSILSNERANNQIFCGSVKYFKNINRNNFIKYRQSRHFSFEKKNYVSKDYLDAARIVTMNMGFRRNFQISKAKFFNERFNFYGFEDYELGFRLLNLGYKIKACSPAVFHNDIRKFSVYLEKIFFLGLESMQYLININYPAAKKNNFYKLEDSFFIKFFIRFNFFRLLMVFLRKLSIFSDRHLVYLPFIYKIGIGSSYLLGCFYKKNKHLLNDLNRKNWYK
jgi:glycosyltransferase involved in cell wall biosynthesis